MQIPTVEHYAIVTSHRIWIPGDERSQTSPGHGYPGEYSEEISYQSYDTLEQLENAIQNKTGTFRILKVNPLKVTVKTSIS